ncbi:unnamed protein product [Gadus morhua 'NCC']
MFSFNLISTRHRAMSHSLHIFTVFVNKMQPLQQPGPSWVKGFLAKLRGYICPWKYSQNHQTTEPPIHRLPASSVLRMQPYCHCYPAADGMNGGIEAKRWNSSAERLRGKTEEKLESPLTQLCSASGSWFFSSSKEGAWISKGPLCAWRESTCSLCRRDGLEEVYTQVPEVLGKALDEQ